MIENNYKTQVIGVDIRVDKTVSALVNIRGEILAREEFATADYPNISEYVTKLADSIALLMEKSGNSDGIRSVGISAPSGNYNTGCIENSPNLPWKGIVPLAAMLRDRLGLAVAVDNNANAIAMAEHAFGAAHGMKDFVLVNLGSGMGSCIFSHGNIHQGTNGFAGEIGIRLMPLAGGSVVAGNKVVWKHTQHLRVCCKPHRKCCQKVIPPL